MKLHRVRVHDVEAIDSKCNMIKKIWWSQTFEVGAENICVVVGMHVVPYKLGVSLCLASSLTIPQLIINGPWVHVQNKRSGRLVACVCMALGDDSNNHVGGASASGHNKYVSTKAI
jgi:hypothetical protein